MKSEAGRATLIIVCGLPCSGKTSRAKVIELQRSAIRLNPDEWMQALAVNLWDATVRARIEALQWRIAQQLL